MKYRVAAFLLFFILFPSASFAQSLNIQTSSDTLLVDPGESFTIPFVITGSGGTHYADIDLPSGWQRTVFNDQFDFRNRRTELIRLRVPSDEPAGTYNVTYRVRSASRLEARETVAVRIKQYRNVKASLSSLPDGVLVGDSLRTVLTLRNESNVQTEIEVIGDVNQTFKLEAGEVRTVPVEKSADERGSENVRVRVFEENDELARLSKSARVYPVSEEPSLDWHKFPIRVGFISSYEDRFGEENVFSQVYVTGSGKLSPQSETKLRFRLESPTLVNTDYFDGNPLGLFSTRSTYRFSLSNPSYDFKAGDQSFQSTTLTGKSFYGFGAGGQYRMNDYQFGGFYGDTRREFSDRRQIGAFVGRTFNERYYIGANFGYSNGFQETGKSVSIDTKLDLTDLLAVDTETSIDFDSGESGASYLGEVRYGNRTHYGRVRYENYSDYNPSFDRGTRFFIGEIGTELLETNANVSYRVDENSLFGNFENRELRARLSRSGFSSFYEYGETGFTDRTTANHTAGASARFGGQTLGFNARGELGWYRFSNDWIRGEKLDGSVDLTVSNFDITAGAGYDSGVNEFSREFDESVDIEGSVTYQHSNFRTGVRTFSRKRIDYRSPNVPDNPFIQNEWRQTYRGFASYRTESDVRFNLETSYRKSFQSDWGVKFETSAPIGVPVKKDRSTGIVTGKVTTKDGDPLSKVTVFVGQRATVSNENGTYTVKQSPGSYNLRVGPNSLTPNDYVVGTETDVNVSGARKTERDIQVVEGGVLQGTIVRKSGNPSAGVVVEVSDGNRTFRQKTDVKGNVKFNALSPGQWNLRLVDELNDEIRAVNNEKKVYTVEKGESTDFRIEVEKDRNIIMIEQEDETDSSSEPKQRQKCEEYTVKKGDWLMKIARQKLNDGGKWPVIYNENLEEIDNPNLIYPGQKLLICPESFNRDGFEVYIVKEGDWLTKIAKKKYSDMFEWPVIYDANMNRIENPDLIYPGQILLIPKNQ